MNSGFSWRITIGKVSPWLLALILGGYIASDRILDISIPITIAGNGNDGGSKNLSPALLKVREEFLKIQNEDDRMLIYKLFSGSAEYLQNSSFVGNTGQFDPILGRVQSSYGWDREKYPTFTDAVSEYLIHVGYDEPRDLDGPESRRWFHSIFENLVTAIGNV
jgi:hypothetical protein